MNLQQLRYLTALAEAGSLSEAGRRLGVSEPVLSRALRSLERELGVPLFAKSGRRLVLTPRGAEVSKAARRALDAVDQVRMSARLSTESGSLRVVTTPTNGTVLNRLVAQVVRLWPDVALTIEIADSYAGVRSRITDGDCELGFAELGHFSPELRTQVMTTEEIVLVSPRGLKLPASVTVDKLDGLPLIMPASPYRQGMLNEWFKSLGVRPALALEADDRSAWLTAAQKGLGSFISYRSPVTQAALSVDIRSFDPPTRVELGFVHRDEPLSTPARMLLEAGGSSEAWLISA
jgi:DNA-binding transcriptional LysR family regulator